jgi:hypothetical protein
MIKVTMKEILEYRELSKMYERMGPAEMPEVFLYQYYHYRNRFHGDTLTDALIDIITKQIRIMEMYLDVVKVLSSFVGKWQPEKIDPSDQFDLETAAETMNAITPLLKEIYEKP